MAKLNKMNWTAVTQPLKVIQVYMNYDNSYHYQFIYLIIYSLFWQTDLHLHSREWDNLLNNGDWSPEVIAGTLPEFFRFVKKVQAIVLEGEGKKY